MKKNILCSLVVLACLALYTELAVAGIQGSQHDLTATGGSQIFRTDEGTEICVFCHTPHGGNIVDRQLNGILPLWNRTNYTQANLGQFQMYTSATFTAQFAYSDNKPTGYSLMCLSCHDGVSSIGWVKNYYPGGDPIPMNYDHIGDLSYAPYKNVNIGRDLRDDHPISIKYDNDLYVREGGVTGALKNPANINSALRLYGPNNPKDFLECPTCHDPHEYGSTSGKAPFLRMSNENSDMCLACHNK